MAVLQKLKSFFRRPLSCEDVNQFILDYLEETLPENTRSRFDAHVAMCPNCSSFFDQYVNTIDLVHEEGTFVIDPPEELVEMTLHFLREHYDDVK